MSFGFGAITDMLGFHAPINLANPIFNIILHVNPVYIGAVIALTRVWDAILDPIMGAVSDNSRFSSGRRRPFIILGSVLTGIFFILMWIIPTGLSEIAYVIFFLIAMLLFYSAFTIFTVPYHAIGYELTSNYHERTSVTAFRIFFNLIGLTLVFWLFRITQLSIFDNPLQGMRYVSVAVGVLIIAFGIIPGLFLRERHFNVAKTQEKIPVMRSFICVFKYRNFVILFFMVLLQLGAAILIPALGLYVNIYHVSGGDIKFGSTLVGLSQLVGNITTGISLFVWPYLSRRFGKRNIMKFSFCSLVIGSILQWFCFTPNYPYLQLALVFFLSPTMAAFWLMLHSMMGDICDEDEHKTGIRREGMFGAVISWGQKFAVSSSYILTGLVLSWIGFEAELEGAQTESAILGLRLSLVLFPTFIGIGLLILLRFYKQTEEKMEIIRSELETRRGSV